MEAQNYCGTYQAKLWSGKDIYRYLETTEKPQNDNICVKITSSEMKTIATLIRKYSR
ncbi:MAG: hypothetical protein ACFFAH_00235 [Promethearchaeota archaeon]